MYRVLPRPYRYHCQCYGGLRFGGAALARMVRITQAPNTIQFLKKIHGEGAISSTDLYFAGSTNLWKRLKPSTIPYIWKFAILLDWKIKLHLTKAICALKRQIYAVQLSILDWKLLELFEILRSHSTLVVHRSRYSCAVVRFSRFQRFVEPAEWTSGNEIGRRGTPRPPRVPPQWLHMPSLCDAGTPRHMHGSISMMMNRQWFYTE
jgi:hypothetical protein